MIFLKQKLINLLKLNNVNEETHDTNYNKIIL